MSQEGLLYSPLHDLHVAAGATMTTVAGWEVPAHYGSAGDEAEAARRSAVVADVSHWGRIRIRGAAAADLLTRLGAAGAPRQEDDTVCAVEIRDAAGGTIDRACLVRLEEMWLLLTSPAGRPAVLGRAQELAAGLDAAVDDQSRRTAMIACLGPQAAARLDVVLPITVSDLADGAAKTGSVLIAKYIALRSDLGEGERIGCHGCASQQPCGSHTPTSTAANGAAVAPMPVTSQAPLWRMEVILPGLLATRAWRFITDRAGENRMPPIGAEAMDLLKKN